MRHGDGAWADDQPGAGARCAVQAERGRFGGVEHDRRPDLDENTPATNECAAAANAITPLSRSRQLRRHSPCARGAGRSVNPARPWRRAVLVRRGVAGVSRASVSHYFRVAVIGAVTESKTQFPLRDRSTVSTQP